MLKPYHIVPFRVGAVSGWRIETTPEYGHCEELPVKKGILTGKTLSWPTAEQAKRALARYTRAYFIQDTKGV